MLDMILIVLCLPHAVGKDKNPFVVFLRSTVILKLIDRRIYSTEDISSWFLVL
jgi:hypothetical protein